jgi:hypothetical protein
MQFGLFSPVPSEDQALYDAFCRRGYAALPLILRTAIAPPVWQDAFRWMGL